MWIKNTAISKAAQLIELLFRCLFKRKTGIRPISARCLALHPPANTQRRIVWTSAPLLIVWTSVRIMTIWKLNRCPIQSQNAARADGEIRLCSLSARVVALHVEERTVSGYVFQFSSDRLEIS